MSIYEYDEEKHMRTLREEGKEEIYYQMFRNDKTPKDISEFTGEPEEYVHQLYKRYVETVCEKEHEYGE